VIYSYNKTNGMH